MSALYVQLQNPQSILKADDIGFKYILITLYIGWSGERGLSTENRES